MAKKPTTVRLSETDLVFAERLAKHWGMSRSQCICRMIAGYRESFTTVCERQGVNLAEFGLGGDQ